MAAAPDEIRLKIPRDRAYHGVARLVLSGLATRRHVTLEGLEDLGLALETLLARQGVGDEVTMKLQLAETEIETSIGPFGAEVHAELEREPGDQVGLRRVLAAVADRVDVTEERGGHWVRFTTVLDPGERAE